MVKRPLSLFCCSWLRAVTFSLAWDRAHEVVEPAVDEVAKKISAAGVNVGLLDAALVVAGINRIN